MRKPNAPSDEGDGMEEPIGRGESRERAPSAERNHFQVFTQAEKKSELRGQIFRNVKLDGADLSSADLSYARFERCSLAGCNFSHSSLRGVEFVDTDLRRSRFVHVRFGKNRFEGALFEGAEGLTKDQLKYIKRHGGSL